MKPSNPYLGVDPLRVSRVELLDAEKKSWHSVLFQQSKSILDFDLNLMQHVLQNSVRLLTKIIYPYSGFIRTPEITKTDSLNYTMADSYVNFLGTNARIADPSRPNQSVDLNFNGIVASTGDYAPSATSAVFTWVELWFQEVAPKFTTESFDGSTSSRENKLTAVYQYGQAPTPAASSSNILTNELKDEGFGAETTRRIQVRWRIRYSPGINPTDYPLGFWNTSTSVSNPMVWAQGGRVTCMFTGTITQNTLSITQISSGYIKLGMVITGIGIATGTTIVGFVTGTGLSGTYTINTTQNISVPTTIFGWFTTSKTFTLATQSDTDFNQDIDTGVYIAGDGSGADATLLNTVDGRVYGIPIGFLTGVTSNNVYATSFDVRAKGLGSANLLAASANSLNLGGTGLFLSNNQITTNLGGTDILLTPLSSGSVIIGGKGSATNGKLQLPTTTNNNSQYPSLSFGTTSSGLYYDSATTSVGIAHQGKAVSLFNSTTGITNNYPTINPAVQANLGYGNLTVGRFVGGTGGAVNGTAPTGGPYNTGDFVVDTSTGSGATTTYVWVCTSGTNGATAASWARVGINVNQTNTWSALNTFSAGLSANVSTGNAITVTSGNLSLTGASSALTISNSNPSVSSSTGALVIQGGLYAGQSSLFNGIVSISNTTDTTGTGVGALIVSGGASFSKKVWVGTGLTINSGNLVVSTGSATVTGNLVVQSGLTTLGNTLSVVTGGMAIVGNSSITNGTFTVNGTNATISTTGVITTTNTTDASGTTQGAIIVAGGVNIRKSLIIGSGGLYIDSGGILSNGDTTLLGNLSVNQIWAQQLSITSNGADIFGDTNIIGDLISTTLTTGAASVQGLLTSSNTTDASSVSIAAITTRGGLGVALKSFFGDKLTITSGGAAITGNSSVTGTFNVTGSLSTAGVITTTNTTDASGTSTGALVVSGGINVAKSIISGSTLYVALGGANITGATTITGALTATGITTVGNSNIVLSSTGITVASGNIQIASGGLSTSTTLSVGGKATVQGLLTSSNTTDASSVSVAAITTTGGLGVALKSFFGDKLTITSGGAAITGNSSITGTLTGLTGLTVASGGLTVSAGGASITGNGSFSGNLTSGTGLTVTTGGASITGNITATNSTVTLANSTLTVENTAVFKGNTDIASTGLFTVFNTTETTAVDTGAVKIAGGTYIAKNALINGTIVTNSGAGGGLAPRVFLPAPSFSTGSTLGATLTTYASTGIAYYSFGSGQQIYVIVQCPANYIATRGVSYTTHGTVAGVTLAYGTDGSSWTTLTSGTTTLVAGTLYYFRLTANSGVFLGLTIKFG